MVRKRITKKIFATEIFFSQTNIQTKENETSFALKNTVFDKTL